MKSVCGRPFIGRKGIGKLALLSCADKITVISKTKGEDYVGGVIDNAALDKAITDDLTAGQYKLGSWEKNKFRKYSKGHQQGTIIYFENIKGGIKNSLDVLKKIVALYFRFSLLDKNFNIFIDGEKITYKHLSELADKTEFIWNINNLNDPFIHGELKNLKEKKKLSISGKLKGFIASVDKPRDLNIMNTDERVSVDLFVNGRLREKDILKYIPTARIAESYLYGQIHFDELDDKDKDRFTSDREGVVSDDVKYQAFLNKLKEEVLKVIIEDWDKWRVKHRKSGDAENPRMTTKQRTSRDLFNAVSDEYSSPETIGKKKQGKVDTWVDELADDASFNFTSYAECFISENLIRNYIKSKRIPLNKEAKENSVHYRNKEQSNKDKGGISIEIRKNTHDLSYLDMDNLAYMIDMDKTGGKKAALSRDADQYKPIRDAVAHTALLTDVAKSKLNSVYENIKGRLNTLLKS